MKNKLTPELLEKAKQAKSPEELIALAKEKGTEMTEESAKAYFEQLHKSGELADDELDNVSGGCGDDEPVDRRMKVSPSDEGCMYYACGICEEQAGTCRCRSYAESKCGTCLHIRYKGDGSAVCNSKNTYEGCRRYT